MLKLSLLLINIFDSRLFFINIVKFAFLGPHPLPVLAQPMRRTVPLSTRVDGERLVLQRTLVLGDHAALGGLTVNVTYHLGLTAGPRALQRSKVRVRVSVLKMLMRARRRRRRRRHSQAPTPTPSSGARRADPCSSSCWGVWSSGHMVGSRQSSGRHGSPELYDRT